MVCLKWRNEQLRSPKRKGSYKLFLHENLDSLLKQKHSLEFNDHFLELLCYIWHQTAEPHSCLLYLIHGVKEKRDYFQNRKLKPIQQVPRTLGEVLYRELLLTYEWTASLWTNVEAFQVSVLITRSRDCQTEILCTMLLNLMLLAKQRWERNGKYSWIDTGLPYTSTSYHRNTKSIRGLGFISYYEL